MNRGDIIKAKTRKQIAFDLDTNVVKKIFGETSYTNIYQKIGTVFNEKAWKHIQGSVYESKNPISDIEIERFIKQLKKRYPYIEKCVRDIRQTEIGRINSLNKHFAYDGTPGKYARKENENSTSKQAVRKTLGASEWNRRKENRKNNTQAKSSEKKSKNISKNSKKSNIKS